jgi:ribonuclease P protein component
MLARPHRLVAAAFKPVRTSGRRARTPHLLFTWISSGSPVSRFGLVVSKKIDKRATRRNSLRRRLHAAIEVALAQNIVPAGLDVIISVNQAPSEKPHQVFLEELTQWAGRLSSH